MTDRRRFSLLPVIAAALLISLSSSLASSVSYAESDIRTSHHQNPAVQIGLFSGLSGLNPGKMLRDVHSGLNTEITPSTDFTVSPLAAAVFDLLQYMRNNIDGRTEEELLAAIPKYSRVEMFGGWVNENSPENCLNTRAEVLMRDATSADKIKFSSQNPCQVYKGEWNDPYSGKTYKLAKAVQIDHVVPLKNAYKSGAYQWTKDRRCHYANYLREDNHLLAVSGHENMSKGDAGPERYLPPNEEYVCEYVHNWLKIKATWSLGFTPNEALAVLETLETHQCNSSTTKVALPKIQNSRLGTIRMNIKCIDEFEAEQVPALKPITHEVSAR